MSKLIGNVQKIYHSDKLLINILIVFITIQPFLDMKWLFENGSLQFLGMTLPTIVRCLLIGIMCLLSLKNIKNNKEHRFYFLYFLAIFIYTIFHCFIGQQEAVGPDTFKFSLITELFYILRMILPFIVVYITKHSKITTKQFFKAILISSLIIGIVVVVGNTLKMSYVSYGDGLTQAGWYQWSKDLLKNYTFEQLTSKGWFYMANQLSGLMVLLLPFNLYALLIKPSKLSLFSTLFLTMAMVMVGTRVTFYGWIIIYVLAIFTLLFFKFTRLDKTINLKNLVYIGLMSPLLIFLLIAAPINYRYYNFAIDQESIDKVPEQPDEEEDSVEVYDYILENYKAYKVMPKFILEIYPYTYDTKFWLDLFKKSEVRVIQSREMQDLLSQRLVELNGNKTKNNLLGYSYSRFRNAQIYIEKDFAVHLITMGYIGTILLLGPYIVALAYITIKIFTDRKSFNLLNCLTILGCGIAFGASILSGHIMDELFITIYIGFVIGYILKCNERGVENEESKA